MQSSQKPVIWTTVIVGIVLLLGGIYGISTIPTDGEIENAIADEIAKIDIPSPDIPTAAEIAAEINIPTTPTQVSEDEENSKLLEGIFDDEYDELEADCQNDLANEFMGDLIEEMRDLIEDDIGEDIENVAVTDFNYRDDYNFEVISLGLENEEDREGTIFTVLVVEYNEVFGNDDTETIKVEATSRCADWDDRNNEFDDLEVNYALA